jgi:hypothetical protein
MYQQLIGGPVKWSFLTARRQRLFCNGVIWTCIPDLFCLHACGDWIFTVMLKMGQDGE